MSELLDLVTRVLATVEGLPRNACGTLVVTHSDRRLGLVLVENNRVCWAAAPGLEYRLRELLNVCAPGGGPNDRELARAAARSATLHTALREHSIESLLALCGDIGEVSFVPRAQPLGARATFTPTELLAAIGARLFPVEASTVSTGMLSPATASGGAYAIDDDGEPVMLAEVVGDRLGVTALVEMGVWAAAALEVTRGFSAAILEQVVAGMTDDVAVAWRASRRVVHALLVPDRMTLATIVATLERRQLPIVVSVRPRWKLHERSTGVVPDRPVITLLDKET